MSLVLGTALICGTALAITHMHHRFELSKRQSRDIATLADRLEHELAKIDGLKQKLDKIAMRVGISQ